MYELYLFARSFTDPVAVTLLVIGVILWKLRDLRKDFSRVFLWKALLLVFFALYIMSLSPFVSLLASTLEKDFWGFNVEQMPKVDVVVVLGGGIIDTGMGEVRLSEESASRLLFGLQVFRHTDAKCLVLSGKGYNTRISEAEVLAEVAQKMGVPQNKIIKEIKSKNTWEQAAELGKIINDKSLHIGIVTSAIHMSRSLQVFKKYFPHLVPIPSSFFFEPFNFSWRTFVPEAQELCKFAFIIHELLGLYWYGIRWNFEANHNEGTLSQSPL